MSKVKNYTKVILQYEADGDVYELSMPGQAKLGAMYDACMAFAEVVLEAQKNSVVQQQKKEEVNYVGAE